MASFIQNMLWNSVEGFVEAGKRTAGGYAGDALIKAGDLVENSGRSVGNGIERKATGYSTTISGQRYEPAAKALPSTARKPAIKRSNSSPAATSIKRVGPTSKTPLGANKFTGGKQLASGVSSAKSVTGNAVGRAKSTTTPKSLPKPYPNNVPSSASAKPNALPKPYGNSSGEKKTAVRPGQPKPFKPQEKAEKPSYSGAGSKTPVRAQTYKPMKRAEPTAEYGKVQHFAV